MKTAHIITTVDQEATVTAPSAESRRVVAAAVARFFDAEYRRSKAVRVIVYGETARAVDDRRAAA